ncbi:ferritin-like domain-containing protein [Phytohalomonas tamaricis]|uniref:ferritin-like domain-containing protein n=1 Tax=Phytohalomonas tamaricis TaxID=2081032 RepID=UPI000D0AD3FC|nr:ferritin-like domain-containing protein [Phytohalomonas tamaricis]
MASKAHEHLLDWLRDAHGMEQQAEQMLKAQAGRLENYPELKARIEQHIEETQHQADLVEGCISKLGGSPSGVKDTGGKMMAMMQGMGGMFTTDEVLKGGIASYAFEHFEMASYRSLIGAAEYAGEPEIKQTCEAILKQEEAMAKWLEDNLPETTMKYLQRDETEGATAKR